MPKQIVVIGSPGCGKCVDPGTWVVTNDGIRKIGSLVREWPGEDQSIPFKTEISGLFGRQETSHFYNGGVKPRIRLQTRHGFDLFGSRQHPVWAMRDGIPQWIQLGELSTSDRVAIQVGPGLFPKQEPPLPQLDDVAPVGYKKGKDVRVPDRMSPDLAEWLGWFVSEGCNQISNTYGMGFCNYSPWVIERMNELNSSLFGTEFCWKGSSTTDFEVRSVRIKKWLKVLAVDGLSAEKVVPEVIMRSTKISQRAYLKAAFEAEASVSTSVREVEFSTASEEMARQIQVMLLNFGILSSRHPKAATTKRWGRRIYQRVLITGNAVSIFAKEIGFHGDVKNGLLKLISKNTAVWDLRGIPVEFVRRQYLEIRQHLKEQSRSFWRTNAKILRSFSGKRSDSPQQLVPRSTVQQGLSLFVDIYDSPGYQNLLKEYWSGKLWDEISSIEDVADGQVVDLTIPEGHSFTGNGIICHNTTAMTRFTDDWFKHGIASQEIAYLAFTKAAANEAASRIIGEQEGFDEEMAQRFPYFRTIHSLAYRGLTKDFPDMRLMTTADMKRFSQWSSLEGTFVFDKWEDLASVYQRLQGGGKTEWDDCLRAYTISRISCRNAADIERARAQVSTKAAKAIGMVNASAYEVFVQKYETYKNDNGLVDFTDMLVHGLTKMKPIDDVKNVVIDEAQDLSPICVALCDRLFQNAEHCFWAGDEDQCIYLFTGADPHLFIDRYNKSDSQIHLQQTHRFGQEVWNQAEKVIRKVSERIPKTVYGLEGKKHHLSVSGEFEPFTGEALILHRHVAGCQELSSIFRNAGMPFRNERGDDPLGSSKRVDNFRTLNDLADGKAVSGLAATEFILEFVPSIIPKTTKRLVPLGAMKKLKADEIPGEVNLYDLQNAKLLTSEGAETIRMRYYNVFDHAEDLEYYHRVLENGHKLSGHMVDGKLQIPIITTMHGSKGRQAKKVVVFNEMSTKCREDKDSEHRLAFVAMTRTEGTLEICAQQTVDWAKDYYDYPITTAKKKGQDQDG